MKCEEVRDELVAYVRGELAPARRTALEEHLVRCGDCTREWEGVRDVLGVMRLADTVSIKELAGQVIRTALERRASDIHIEKSGGKPRVRFRIDGLLHVQPDLAIPDEQYDPLITRIKYMAQMHMSENQLPHDGRISIQHQGVDMELRVSVFPYFDGGSAVLRIVDRRNVLLGLDRLGFTSETLAPVEAMLARCGGLVMCTGPTGSGKTTTLYAMLQRLSRPEVKITTIEDPVEYRLEGVNQASVNRKAGLTFAPALRGLMRQDPDAIMVGEIRDLETLEMAAAAAMTGHLILSVLHTPDAPSAVTRMLDVGLAPFLVSQSVSGVIGQRLVRHTCPDCREPYQPAEALLHSLGFRNGTRPETFVHGKGCDACAGTGYQGRTGLFEVLSMDRELGQLLADGASEAVLRARALDRGLLWPFAADARTKISDGTTTVEEVDRVLPGLTAAPKR